MAIPQIILDDLNAVDSAFSQTASDVAIADADAASLVTAQAAVSSAQAVQSAAVGVVATDQQNVKNAIQKLQDDVQSYYGVPAANASVAMIHALHHNACRHAESNGTKLKVNWQDWLQKVLAFLEAIAPLIPVS